MEIKGPISLGELIDKITILEIKTEKINETEKLKNISNELGKLFTLLDSLQLNKKDFDKYSKQLYEVNKKLWETEDILRALENKKSFNKDFIENARNVYKLNDERFRIKNKLNKQFSSEIIEEKSYKDYK
jgi:ABC-type phosphate transport system auxiliary subunit